jgi:hypothetical protein
VCVIFTILAKRAPHQQKVMKLPKQQLQKSVQRFFFWRGMDGWTDITHIEALYSEACLERKNRN